MAQMVLQKLDTNLAVQGIGAFDLPQAQSNDNVGGHTQIVSDASGVLLEKARKMTAFKGELEAAKTSLLDGTWTGQAADDFSMAFPGVLTAFENIAPCIQSMGEWAQSTMDAYAVTDQAAAGALADILGMRG